MKPKIKMFALIVGVVVLASTLGAVAYLGRDTAITSPQTGKGTIDACDLLPVNIIEGIYEGRNGTGPLQIEPNSRTGAKTSVCVYGDAKSALRPLVFEVSETSLSRFEKWVDQNGGGFDIFSDGKFTVKSGVLTVDRGSSLTLWVQRETTLLRLTTESMGPYQLRQIATAIDLELQKR
jgi:hypothetical protein